MAREAGGESIVLLKNTGRILPLNLEKLNKIATIGAFAKTPRYQGSGSSQVNPTEVSNAYAPSPEEAAEKRKQRLFVAAPRGISR